MPSFSASSVFMLTSIKPHLNSCLRNSLLQWLITSASAQPPPIVPMIRLSELTSICVPTPRGALPFFFMMVHSMYFSSDACVSVSCTPASCVSVFCVSDTRCLTASISASSTSLSTCVQLVRSFLHFTISLITESAISSGVCPPIARPIGECNPDMVSCENPDSSRSFFTMTALFFEPIIPT